MAGLHVREDISLSGETTVTNIANVALVSFDFLPRFGYNIIHFFNIRHAMLFKKMCSQIWVFGQTRMALCTFLFFNDWLVGRCNMSLYEFIAAIRFWTEWALFLHKKIKINKRKWQKIKEYTGKRVHQNILNFEEKYITFCMFAFMTANNKLKLTRWFWSKHECVKTSVKLVRR